MTSEAEAQRRPTGRPPRGPKSGKGSTLATRITSETREALELEAARTGRSLSQVAELWLEEARRGRASYQALLGGTQMAATIEQLVQFARQIRDEVGDPETAAEAREQLLAGWKAIIDAALPTAPMIEAEKTALRARDDVQSAGQALVQQMISDDTEARVAGNGTSPLQLMLEVASRDVLAGAAGAGANASQIETAVKGASTLALLLQTAQTVAIPVEAASETISRIDGLLTKETSITPRLMQLRSSLKTYTEAAERYAKEWRDLHLSGQLKASKFLSSVELRHALAEALRSHKPNRQDEL